jgi:ribosome-associated protein
MQTFSLQEAAYIELNKLLKLMKWVATGGEAHIHIENGEVLIDGTIATEKRKKIRKGNVVRFRNQEVEIV